MKALNVKILLTLVTVATFSCSSGELRVQSTPSEAKVTLLSSDGDSQDLGRSPISIDVKDIKLKAPFFLDVSKEGFKSQSIFIPELKLNSQIKAQISLLDKSQELSNYSSSNLDGNKIVREISLVHNHITKKEYSEAQNRLLMLTSQHSGISSLWSLLGNVYYLQRKWDSALEAYAKAFDLDPQATEVKSMMDRVKSLKGGG